MQIKLNNSVLASVVVAAVLAFVEFIGIPGISLTSAQEKTAAILVIAAILWVSEWVPLFVTSFLILALEIVWLYPQLAIVDPAISTSVFFEAFFSNIILLFLGGFVLSSLMQKYSLDLHFAQAILSRTKGHASYTLLGIITVCAFLSMWISNTATTAMMLTIVFPLIKRIAEQHSFRIALTLSIPFACNIGGIGTPIGTPPNAIAMSNLSKAGISLSFFDWMLLCLPFVILLLLFLWQLLLRLYPAKDIVLELDSRPVGDFGIKQWAALAIFFLTALGWLLGGQLGLKTGTVALLPVVVCFWYGLLDTSDFRKLPWDVLYIISGGLALGIALQKSGLGEVVVTVLPANPIALFILGAAIAGAMSTVMSNTATAGLVIPLVMAVDANQGMLTSLVIAVAMSCSLAMALPVTTPPNAIAFSSGAIKSKDMMLAGGIMTLFGISVALLLGPSYWGLIIGNT